MQDSCYTGLAMPSTRVASFIDATVLEAELVPTATERALPPASAELCAPSDVAVRSDKRRRQEHPAKVGRPTNDEAAEAASIVFDAMKREMTVPETAARIGAGQDGSRVKAIMKTAREVIRERLTEYVDIHLVAAKVAALKGDAGPAEWALENLDVDGERVVTPPSKNQAPTAPTFNLGFVLGGMPRQLPTTTKE